MLFPPGLSWPRCCCSLVAQATLAGSATTREPDEAADGDPLLAKASVPHSVARKPSSPPPRRRTTSIRRRPGRSRTARAGCWRPRKASEKLVIYDGDSGATLRTFGTAGQGPGQFKRANGIFVHRDLVFVVERDNHRVQVLRAALLAVRWRRSATKELVQPYGIWLQETQPGKLRCAGHRCLHGRRGCSGDDVCRRWRELGRARPALRGARRRRIGVGANTSVRSATPAQRVRSASGIGLGRSRQRSPAGRRGRHCDRHRCANTISAAISRAHDRRSACSRRRPKASRCGHARTAAATGSPTDQYKDRSLFHVFDRRTLHHVGAFAGKQVGNTDGVWLHQAGSARFPKGVFYAVHDDMAVGAFDWRDVAKALSLRQDCG